MGGGGLKGEGEKNAGPLSSKKAAQGRKPHALEPEVVISRRKV